MVSAIIFFVIVAIVIHESIAIIPCPNVALVVFHGFSVVAVHCEHGRLLKEMFVGCWASLSTVFRGCQAFRVYEMIILLRPYDTLMAYIMQHNGKAHGRMGQGCI